MPADIFITFKEGKPMKLESQDGTKIADIIYIHGPGCLRTEDGVTKVSPNIVIKAGKYSWIPAQPTAAITFETKKFDEIDEKILTSEDTTGTAQTGWRREKNQYFPFPIFLREHLSTLKTKLDSFMSHSQEKHMYISGPPGSGKTTYCLFYFTLYMVKNNTKGLIVQYRQKGFNEVMIIEGQHILRVASLKASGEMSKIVAKVIEGQDNNPFDFCIFDGVRESNQTCENISSTIINGCSGKGTKVIQITSLEFDIKGGDGTGGINGIDSFGTVSSWKLEDYEKLVDSDLLDIETLQKLLCLGSDFQTDDEDVGMEDDQNEEGGNETEDTMKWLKSLLKRKYYYAGGSARYMLDYSIAQLISNERSVFGKLCERMTQENWKQFAELKISSSTPISVSSGMQLIDGRYSPVSEYFLRVAHKECKEELTSSVRAAATASDNPALKGWAFELEQLDIIEHTMKTNTRILASEDQTLILPLTSEETSYDGNSIKNITSDTFTIWCSKWNQGCFDIAFYNNQHLITANFTTAESHSLKINPIRDLKDALGDSGRTVSKFTHIAVVEEKSRCDSFSFDTAEGAGRPVESALFSLETARSQKLTAKVVHGDNNPKYGIPLGTIYVYPREWKSERKRRRPNWLPS